MAGSLMKFLSKPENKETECQEDIEVALTSTTLNQDAMDVIEEKDICFLEGESSKMKEGSAEEPVSSLLSSAICSNLDCGDDPGLWPVNVTNDLVNILVNRGPIQASNCNFPINDDGRKFTGNYYYRNLPNGEKHNRE